jgi:hypothetical protein
MTHLISRLLLPGAIIVALALTTVPAGASAKLLTTTESHDVTSIPASVFNSVGVSSGTQMYTPLYVKGQPALSLKDSTGAARPGIVYMGAEYCPYCAAERWAIAAALSRFGTFSNLGATTSAASDVYPSTQTIDFYGSGYVSKYVTFQPVEMQTNYLNKAKNAWATLQTPTKAQIALRTKYDSPKYFPGVSTSSPPIPFIDIDNQFLLLGSSFTPQLLHGLSRASIAASLDKPKTTAAKAIIVTANFITAAICHATGGQPGAVCNTPAVKSATPALKITK